MSPAEPAACHLAVTLLGGRLGRFELAVAAAVGIGIVGLGLGVGGVDGIASIASIAALDHPVVLPAQLAMVAVVIDYDVYSASAPAPALVVLTFG